MWKRCWRLLGSTNRYTDGSGRRLDSSEPPKELDLQPISNRAYPVRGEHWQPVLAGEPSPQKGDVVISGAGVVGLTMAALFALRGWHTSVVEQHASPLMLPLRGAASPMQAAGAAQAASDAARHSCGPFVGLQHALVTRRAADALEAAGLSMGELRQCGVAVSGVMDHPGAYNSWLTRGLTEHHPFAVKMLSMDLLALRQLLELHVQALPTGNCRVFHEHVVEAVYPLRQQLVVKPIRESHTHAWRMQQQQCGGVHQKDDAAAAGGEEDAKREGVAGAVAVARRRPRMETSLTLHRAKWERKFAAAAVEYDLLVSAEGANSNLRDLVDVEGFAADEDFAIRWFLLMSSELSHAHIHRWLQKRREAVGRGGVCSPCQVPLAIAFPRHHRGGGGGGEDNAADTDDRGSNSFALMVYGPAGEIERLSDAEVLRSFCPDLAGSDATCRLRSLARGAVPHPTIYCENLFNSVGLPSAVVVGDAAHTCNPFWLQGLAMGLEDGVNLLNQVDAYSKHFYDAIRQYSQERGCSGDALREITDRCLYYERMKHINPFLRLQNSFQRGMNLLLPQALNEYYTAASVNHLYAKSLEDMLNGRGYTSYEYAEKQQAKHCAFYQLGRVYT
ncbi:putative flavoprotein monooxygenase [Trypanosoma conorhini]|uniref:Putative flavoprotein monooxygenase n=1 Tax=Trypanosoma conorhini TaxID=83891 RepID=A0A422P8H4_9TRYP|nr:putative flavoprotein monooxygenase [Trypanosoma conorhini]RNF14023.1 putative flavoprotein monooxygenase [Trypanosoma conorhini]